ncbi:winged helix-turn-helix transcriptional regulator [Nocardioides renjunii]|uniref:winged helix-turn-helix transcriptional regulator n=1 Tax=Nocardioides renjunii TaxID=3095075 RepID=UPI002AFEFF0B|nr:helix-turn-helix domain-containing protein [Nocardioides sp. S-34]WQQ24433.1 helix-turn-helix domain-containing protein [Nocardioides sp. S-34]
MNLEGALAHRDNRPVGAYCSIERALDVLSTRSAMLVLREAFYGATRFEEFAARADLTDATTAARLRDLVRTGILDTRPYQEPGQRRRHEYVLTPAGNDLMPALFALLQWANRHDPPPYPPQLTHHQCGQPVSIEARCEAGHPVTTDDITVTAAGPFGLDDPIAPDG